jgi:hypothetical protein
LPLPFPLPLAVALPFAAAALDFFAAEAPAPDFLVVVVVEGEMESFFIWSLTARRMGVSPRVDAVGEGNVSVAMVVGVRKRG